MDGDQYLCEGVASLSYIKNENPKTWEKYEQNQSLVSADRAWNDPEDIRVYNTFITATNLLKDQADYTISLIFGN